MNGLERENEAVKLMTLRGGLLDLSQAWKTLGAKCNVIAESQKVGNSSGRCLGYSVFDNYLHAWILFVHH